MINLSPKMLEILTSRNIKTNQEIEEFLNPSISLLSNPLSIKDMDRAAKRINSAIAQKETILIYGDYDADGVCASAIMYKFFKSKGIEPLVFIPNRFEDGYGLSENTVNYIAENLFPDLVITVDCGITSVAEVDLFSELGIDVVVTDHHMPQNILPNAVAVVDAKRSDETCSFHDYCGAGIALKLVQALGGDPMDYIDIAAIATIGDIVPLLGENRVIAALGINKINSPNCNKGISELIKLLMKSDKLSSQDIAFKIVPRINAAGRMKNAIISFNLLKEDSLIAAKEIAEELENINALRMQEISTAMQQIAEMLKTKNLNDSNCIVVSSKSFHEGIIGIVATKLVEDYNLPCFVFTETVEGLFKGSCRSTEDIDIHKILSQLSNLLVTFGGHKQAAGMTISKSNFNEFKEKLKNLLPKAKKDSYEPKYDYDVSESDLTLSFAKELDLLEPTGCANEKPVFKLALTNCTYKKTSNPKHYQLITQTNKYFPIFNGKSFENSIASNNAFAYFTLSSEVYNSQFRLKPKIEKIYCNKISKLDENKELSLVCDLFNSFESSNEIKVLGSQEDCLLMAKELIKSSGTLIVSRTIDELNAAKKQLNIPCYYDLPNNQESCIIYCPKDYSQIKNIQKYNNIILLSGTLSNKCCTNGNTISYMAKFGKFSHEKQVFADCYRVICGQRLPEMNDIYEYVEAISKYLPYSQEQIAFCLAVFNELKFIKTKSNNGNFFVSVSSNKLKTELNSSKIFNLIKSMTA